MAPSQHSPPGTHRVIIGAALTFLGVALLALGSTVDGRGWAELAAALGVVLTGLGLLLHTVVQSASGGHDSDPAADPSDPP